LRATPAAGQLAPPVACTDDGALEDPELVAESEDLDDQLGAGSEAGEAGKNQRPEEVQNGCGAREMTIQP
jgi:hypothetical protein